MDHLASSQGHIGAMFPCLDIKHIVAKQHTFSFVWGISLFPFRKAKFTYINFFSIRELTHFAVQVLNLIHFSCCEVIFVITGAPNLYIKRKFKLKVEKSSPW